MTRNTMLTEDYLIRMINQAIAALAAIVGLKTAGQYLEAQTAIDEFLEQIFGLRPDLMKHLDDRNLIDTLTNQDILDTDRLSIAADLLKEQGDLLAAQGNSGESFWSYLRALNFHLEVALAGGPKNYPPPDEKITALTSMLQQNSLPPDTLFALYAYHEQAGNYARAAAALDRLAATPGMSADMMDEQAAFYRRLLEKPAADLERGGLTQAEVEARLMKFHP